MEEGEGPSQRKVDRRCNLEKKGKKEETINRSRLKENETSLQYEIGKK